MAKSITDHLLTECMYFTANQLARAITRLAEEEFRVTGLSPTYAFLMIVVNDQPGISQKELGEILHIAPSTITRFIEKLQNKDLVYSKQHGRQSLIYPTEQGKKLLPVIEEAWMKLYRRYCDVIGEQFAIQLTEEMYQVGLQLEKKLNKKKQ